MTQIFGIHTINGLPSTNDALLSYNIPLIENLTDNQSGIQLYNQSGNQSDNLYDTNKQYLSSVYIASDPVGAKIFIDDIEQIGFTTPSMITDIPAGHHNFKLISPGNVDIESSMPLDPGKTYNIFLTMGKTTSTSTYINTPDIIILLAIGVIGYLLIRNK